jgi:hypothetical protein
MKSLPGSAAVLSGFALVGAAVASVTTLLWSGAFPNPSPVPAFNGPLAEARGWSVVTGVVVLPMLIVSLSAAMRGSLRGRLVWLGTLAYLVYTYLEFAVSPPFTALFLVYIVTFACAIPALVLGVVSIDTEELARVFSGRVPRRTVGVFGLVMGLLLSIAWLKDIAARTIAGDFGWPRGEAAIGHVVHALDLGLQVPLCIAAGLLLLRRRSAGYVVAAVMLVNSVCMGVALVAMVVAAAMASGKSTFSALPFAIVPAIALALTIAFFRTMRSVAFVEKHDRVANSRNVLTQP